MINQYAGIAPRSDLLIIQKLGKRLRNRTYLHINSTRSGGGVAEILHRMVPFLTELGIQARWEVIGGDPRFFDITKKIHNALQGNSEEFTHEMWEYHKEINAKNAATLNLDADAVMIHDPQPLPLIQYRKNGSWIWRCHIDVSNPQPEVWNFVRTYCEQYRAAIFSVSKFAQAIPIDEFIVSPSIDPISDKNRDLTDAEIQETISRFSIPTDRPIILQVSRFDRFKDPVGVINAYRLVKKYNDCILILAGSPATDDPESEVVLREVREYAESDPNIMILMLAPFSDKDINVLQRIATVVIQKSLKEGFGLTVAEAMWKRKPVIGGAVGGIPRQIVHGVTGFLSYSVEGTAFRIRQFLNNPDMAKRMGERAREYVRQNFLITRQIRDYLAVWYAVEHPGRPILEM